MASKKMMAKAMAKARRKASETGNRYAVVEIDTGIEDERRLSVASWSYVFTDEFAAFNGEILAEVVP